MVEQLKLRQDELRARIQQIIGDVETLGTLRRQAADLSAELGDYGVVIAIDQSMSGEWIPGAVKYKYAHFFTHWAVLAIMKLADPHRDSTSIPILLKRACAVCATQGEMRRDRWVERIAGISRWREARDAEEKERLQRLIATGGGPIWSQIGPGEEAARLNEAWNLLTGRERGSDSPDDDVEDWIFESSVRSLTRSQVQAVREWRDTAVAHQDIRRTRTGSAGYDVFPIWTLIRSYWAVITALHRVLLLAEGSGLHGLLPTAQFSVAEELSGGVLEPSTVEAIDERLALHSVKWERLLRQSEQRWYLELNETRRKQNGRH